MAKPAIALYLGESYATIGLFEVSFKKQPRLLYEKSIFLPQVSLKHLLNQTKIKIQEFFPIDTPNLELVFPIYLVTKYFNRLKQFRLGGSISQVVLKGFENSYTLNNSKSLSLAASQLIIALEPDELKENFLKEELARIKKINPDLNKIVISIPETQLTTDQITLLNNFFSAEGLKIFNCLTSDNLSSLRKTLLNAGSEGTKDEIISDLKEAFGENIQINFFCKDEFKSQFENCELFNSSDNFLTSFVKSKNHSAEDSVGAYFDIESLKFFDLTEKNKWESPWGPIPIDHYSSLDLCINSYSEVKLNHLSVLDAEGSQQQLEPGPVLAGRAIKPLVIDLFYQELLENKLAHDIFPQLTQENLNQKIQNLFAVLEKGQKHPSLFISVEDLKRNISDSLQNEILYHSNGKNIHIFGPLANIFLPHHKQKNSNKFLWPHEIISKATKDSL